MLKLVRDTTILCSDAGFIVWNAEDTLEESSHTLPTIELEGLLDAVMSAGQPGSLVCIQSPTQAKIYLMYIMLKPQSRTTKRGWVSYTRTYKAHEVDRPAIIEIQKQELLKTHRPLTSLDLCTATIGSWSIMATNPYPRSFFVMQPMINS